MNLFFPPFLFLSIHLSFLIPSIKSFVKSDRESKVAKLLNKDNKYNASLLDGLSHCSRKMANLGEYLYTPEVENYPLKAKNNGNMHDFGHLQNSAAKWLEDNKGNIVKDFTYPH
ncbi:hypothetical protein LOK49_LG14G02078 [Camellia lanceoleosa]|uniref:Uncharacterized protein n=1 Tax=Camellia lanceoleosa TaxID=1840588 RepID=A0ACC0FBA2_9ERIC|nr:hypothetical protein LOK49_LG14G02078 [Camellia lanceoleosa]